MPVIQFKGKTAVESYHRVVPHHTLEIDAKLSELGDGKGKKRPSLDGNLIVEGDNLIALKSLLPTHAGRIKCIYIDPPYNTGNEGWVYNDNLTQPQFKEWIGQVVGKEGEDATRHDKWCCMMYPRLQLLKELLTDDGAIFISIDDNEVHHLRMLMDEVFGPTNFIVQLVWEKGRKNDAKLFSSGHEYMVGYARSMETLRTYKTVWREPKPGAKEIWAKYLRLRTLHGGDNGAIEKDLRAWYKELPDNDPSKALSRYKHVDENGPWRDRDISWPGGGGPKYPVKHPTTGKPCRIPEAGWRFSEETMKDQIRLNLVEFRDDESEPPFRKAHLVPVADELDDEDAEILNGEPEEAVGMQVMGSYIYKQSQVAVRHLRKILGGKAFANPKDNEILARVFRYCTGEEDIILDSFAGSGTTAEAVLRLNKDGGNRRFALVQQPYDSKENEKERLNICEKITAERVRRVSRGYSYKTPNGKTEKVAGLGGDFTYARVGPVLMDEYRDLGKKLPSYEQLARYIFFTETSQNLDPEKMDEKTGFIGEWKDASYYLLYTPKKEEARPLDEPFLKTLKDKNRRKVIYCEKVWIHREDLAAHGDIRPMLVPFNLK
jgi:adenine-specific DNA-methyltransferase